MISYAQNFEDLILWEALKGIVDGFYIEIGAEDPLTNSVSRSFYEAGWRGVHVEPSPYYAAKLRRERPEEQVLEFAVGGAVGTIPFFLFPDTGLSTGVAEIARAHEAAGYRLEEIRSSLKTMAQLLEPYSEREIHWMKIDCEGMRSGIIDGWKGSGVRPWIVVVTGALSSTQNDSDDGWEDALMALGYDRVYSNAKSRFYVSEEKEELTRTFRCDPNYLDYYFSKSSNLATHDGAHEAAIQKNTLTEIRDEVGASSATASTLRRDPEAVLKSLEAQVAEGLDILRSFNVARSSMPALFEVKLENIHTKLDLERERAVSAKRLCQLLERRGVAAESEIVKLRGELEQARSEVVEWRATANHWRRISQSFTDSTSWKITGPVRAVKRTLANLLHLYRISVGGYAPTLPTVVHDVALTNSASAIISSPAIGLRVLSARDVSVNVSPVLKRAGEIFAELTASETTERFTLRKAD